MNLTAQIVKKDIQVIAKYFNELKGDQKLKELILDIAGKSPLRKKKDRRCDYGNKLALFAIVRALKPAVVVENGIEMGFTSIVLCEAIRKNIEEGYPGRFIGLDINDHAGYLVNAVTNYRSFSEIRCGDAVESLKSINTKIDFYFSDGFRSYEYEQKEFASLEKSLSDGAIVITNKATFSKALFEFAQNFNKNYSFFKEHPLGHWYEGAGLGFMYS
jgi:predicted O-methyltransferase YrrM